MSKYELKPLTDICKIRSGGTPKTGRPEYWNGRIAWASVKDFNIGQRWFYSTEKTISEEGLESCSSDLLEPGDLVLSARGTVGVIAQCKIATAFNQSNYGLKAIAGVANSGFVYYAIVNARTNLLMNSHGGMFDTITRETLSRLNLPLPNLKTQTKIEEILGALDRKIESNNEISMTIETIAQTIFKSWFIDFDPVKAKMAGEKPVGMDDATAALFPDLMEDSELGQIPTGWNWGSVGDVAQVIDCLHSKKPELVHQGQPYLQLDTIHDDGILRFERAAQISDADYQKWTSRIEVHDGDCVITNVGRVGAVSQVPCHFKGAIGRNITAIRPTDGKNSKTFLAIALTSSFMKREIRTNTDSGTILEALNVRSIPKLRLPIASAQIFELFEELCGPMQAQRHNLHRQNVQLAGLRDSLLPRLISGELQIPEEMLVS